MNCFIVQLRCGMDDLIVGVRGTADEARDLAGHVAYDVGPFLDRANKVYNLDASEVMAVSLVTVRDGHVAEVENVPLPEGVEDAPTVPE